MQGRNEDIGISKQASLRWLGTLGGKSSRATGVSADGLVVVGSSVTADGVEHAFCWTATDGIRKLEAPKSYQTFATDISTDGSVIVGYAVGENKHAVWWTGEGRIQELGPAGSSATAVSGSGSVAVGMIRTRQGLINAFVWKMSEGLSILGTLGGRHSIALDVSHDGSVIVGGSKNVANLDRAFRWTADKGFEDIGALSDNFAMIRVVYAMAHVVSADGRVIFGESRDRRGQLRAFRWTELEGMQDIGALGVSTEPRGASVDGSIVVGASHYHRPFLWVFGGAMEDMNVVYANLLDDGSSLLEANAISVDGRYIVGQGFNAKTGRNEAFLLDSGICLTSKLSADAIDVAHEGERIVLRATHITTNEIQGRHPVLKSIGPSLAWLGTFGGDESEAWSVSADGSVVVGRAQNATGQFRAFKWTSSSGIAGLATVEGHESWALCVSADGSTIAGTYVVSDDSTYAVCWLANDDVGVLLSLHGEAFSISADGSIVVGSVRGCPFLWKYDLTQYVGMYLTNHSGVARGVSADGAFVVGWYNPHMVVGNETPFLWTLARGMRRLPHPEGCILSRAFAISADGSVIVGRSWDSLREEYRATIWTADGSVQNLETPGRGDAAAMAVSEDGRVVVGWFGSVPYRNFRAVRWTETGGVEDLNVTYADLLTDGSYLSEALFISPNGRWIVGYGLNAKTGRSEAYLLDTGYIK